MDRVSATHSTVAHTAQSSTSLHVGQAHSHATDPPTSTWTAPCKLPRLLHTITWAALHTSTSPWPAPPKRLTSLHQHGPAHPFTQPSHTWQPSPMHTDSPWTSPLLHMDEDPPARKTRAFNPRSTPQLHVDIRASDSLPGKQFS
ncbi:hypothetical protein MANES_18G145774v8 [Manihot esculenta]|uniref:Uncharacterized protein n=1 Tax=Manihot esculenta TaxID=3983 RepID=A0ACB7G1U9_MANES|nr:hypothetical protein MANES_18G145774v8 [Manihot esculenta]